LRAQSNAKIAKIAITAKIILEIRGAVHSIRHRDVNHPKINSADYQFLAFLVLAIFEILAFLAMRYSRLL
jgi:hypothetical protein